jgi:hypothetical protein
MILLAQYTLHWYEDQAGLMSALEREYWLLTGKMALQCANQNEPYGGAV